MGELLHGLSEFETLVVHDETERVTTRATAEAVIELLIGVYRERWCFFLMERTAGGIVFASLFEFYPAIDHVHDVGAIEHLIYKRLWESGHIRDLSGCLTR